MFYSEIARICKRRENGRVVEIVEEVVFGEPENVLRLLGADSGGRIIPRISRD